MLFRSKSQAMADSKHALRWDDRRDHAAPPIRPAQRPTLCACLLALLVPAALLSALLAPLGLALTLVPLTLVFGLPLWLASSLLLVYSLAAVPYLLFAQEDLSGPPALLLPLSPLKALRIVHSLFKQLLILLRSSCIELVLDYSYRKIIVLGRNRAKPTIVRRGIVYAYADHARARAKRLDVYLPPLADPQPATAPVLFFVHPGGWRWLDKDLFLQLGLRLRRLGFCVVIPDFTQFPEGRCHHSVRDIRCALRWVARSISEYGGDPDRIFVAGHGSGAHLALLTVLESAIAQSLAEQEGCPSPLADGPEEEEALELPHVEGMVLLAGVYDPVAQMRAEARKGWLDVSALRRALGPSHALALANSPAHLLHAAQETLRPRHLPDKVLIIHGGQDRNVPILQSHFLSTLLETVNRHAAEAFDAAHEADARLKEEDGPAQTSVRFVPLKDLDHLSALFALMLPDSTLAHQHQGYSKIIVEQILSLVQ